jgi:hypothetical protein
MSRKALPFFRSRTNPQIERAFNRVRFLLPPIVHLMKKRWCYGQHLWLWKERKAHSWTFRISGAFNAGGEFRLWERKKREG